MVAEFFEDVVAAFEQLASEREAGAIAADPRKRRNLLSLESRQWIAGLRLPATAREQLDISLEIIDALDIRLVPFDSELHAIARKQPGCRALIKAIYGVGDLTAVTILAELGDVRRFQNSRDVVRYGGLDITVYQSDEHRAPGHLSRQGPPAAALGSL